VLSRRVQLAPWLFGRMALTHPDLARFDEAPLRS
jgi:hypothetical protein